MKISTLAIFSALLLCAASLTASAQPQYQQQPLPAEYTVQDVPHGQITTVKYRSELFGDWREMWVYTPAEYNKGSKKYPVLYLQHGGGGNHRDWFEAGCADNILDNMIAAGNAVPMVVVCIDAQMPIESGRGQYNWECMQTIRDELADCVIPVVEKNFRVLKDVHHRAICGLSMGAGQSYFVGLRCPELFRSAGIFSAGVFSGIGDASSDMEHNIPGIYSDTERFNKEHDLVFISCGDADERIEGTTRLTKEMQDHGVNLTFKVYPGNHEWAPWRDSFRDYIQLLFK